MSAGVFDGLNQIKAELELKKNIRPGEAAVKIIVVECSFIIRVYAFKYQTNLVGDAHRTEERLRQQESLHVVSIYSCINRFPIHKQKR